MDITRLQSTNIEAGKELGKGPMNTFVNIPAYPPADLKASRTRQLRYALLHCVAGPHQRAAGRIGAGYGRTVLPPADA